MIIYKYTKYGKIIDVMIKISKVVLLIVRKVVLPISTNFAEKTTIKV